MRGPQLARGACSVGPAAATPCSSAPGVLQLRGNLELPVSVNLSLLYMYSSKSLRAQCNRGIEICDDCLDELSNN